MFINPLNTDEASAGWIVICDFDGTVSFRDVTDTLLEAFGKPGWQALEQRWENKEIGSRDCMAGQIALLDVSRQQLDECLNGIAIDPDFASFARNTRLLGVPLYIVSDGLDYAIHYILHAHGLDDIPVIANRLVQVRDRQWRLEFPYYSTRCKAVSGTCKCAVADALVNGRTLMIGDGRSDYCISQRADYVFAKGSLVAECRRNGTPFSVMNNFSGASAGLARLLELNSESDVHRAGKTEWGISDRTS